MAMGTRKDREEQEELWVPHTALPKGASHPFYQRLNQLLEESHFDEFVEGRCQRFYAKKRGRPSLVPGVYFRLLLIGYFEGIDSERGMAWRANDSLALRRFLRVGLEESPPDHSTISRTRRLIDVETHREVFTWVLGVLAKKGLLKGKTLGIDATTLEANAALRTIVRRDTGEGYQEFLKRLAQESGIATPTRGDTASVRETVCEAGEQIATVAGEETSEGVNPEGPKEVVLDKGYHSNEVLTKLAEWDVRSYCSEPERGRRRWEGKQEEQAAVYGNRRQIRGERGKRLLRQRGEKLERSFAHLYETGGMRRVHLRRHPNILKRLLVHVAAFNLGLVMRRLCGKVTPQGLQGCGADLLWSLLRLLTEAWARGLAPEGDRESFRLKLGVPEPSNRPFLALAKKPVSTTGC